MRTIQSMFRAFKDMSYGTNPYGAEILKEFESLPGVKLAVVERRYFKSYPRPKTEVNYTVSRFQYYGGSDHEYWKETSSMSYTKKSEANKAFNALVKGLK